MFNNLNVFKTAQALAEYAAVRQNVVSHNLANADTPGFAAKQVVRFEMFLEADRRQNHLSGSTRSRHLNASLSADHIIQSDRRISTDPNGNSVSLEEEMLRSVDTKQQHDRALAIYRSSLNLLRLSLGRR